MSIEFTATEIGFADGLGGASNSTEANADYHYVLFGKQTDKQHPENSGVYFKYDDQINGGVNNVDAVTITDCKVTFNLMDSKTIVVRSNSTEGEWQSFVQEVQDAFGEAITI